MRTLLRCFLLMFLLLFIGCEQLDEGSSDLHATGPGASAEEGTSSEAPTSTDDSSAPAIASVDVASSGEAEGESMGASEPSTSSGSEGGAVDAAPAVEGGSPDPEAGGPTQPAPQAGQLTAAEWRDLDNWAFFRGLFDDVAQGQGQSEESGAFAGIEETWGIFTAGRIPVIVHAGGKPTPNVRVVLTGAEQAPIFEARTDNKGRAELFANMREGGSAEGLSVTIFAEDNVTPVQTLNDLDAGLSEAIEIDLGNAPAPAAEVLDLMFVIDTTGSMGDELSYLQKELEDVIAQVVDHNSEDLQIRLSLNFYRDNGDLYVVRSNPFTTNISEAIEALLKESANGGGDYPEAVEDAMDDAIFNHQWSEDAVARMLFLVLDAPPHHNDNIVAMLGDTLEEAARLGVRVFPLAASGVDKSTEALLRLMQVATGGSYLFLTDDSGIGASHLEPTIGDYDVELLRDLLVRLIDDNVAMNVSVEPHAPIL